jgi:hypothetical protein
VQDAVLDQDVSVDDASGVDENRAVGADGDVELFAVESGEFGVVFQGGAVADGACDDVVLEDGGEFFVGGGEVCGGEALEGVVVGAEDCDVGGVFEGRDEFCLGCGAGEGGEVAGDEGFGDAEGDEEEFVDDVDYAVVEGEVLGRFVSSAGLANFE